MLIEFRVSNFRSFHEEQVLSMVAGNVTELPENVIDAPGGEKFRLLRSAAVYGPNASGKSNLVKAIAFFSGFVSSSAEKREPDDVINRQHFALNPRTSKLLTSFEASFLIDGVRYQYGYAVGSKRVREEWLYAYPKSRAQKWFHRETDSRGVTTIDFGSSLLGAKQRLKDVTRADALFLSVAANWNHAQLTTVFEWIAYRLRHIYRDDTTHLRGYTAGKLRDEPAFHNAMVSLLRTADIGIRDVSVKAVTPAEVPSFDSLPMELREQVSSGDLLATYFVHATTSGESEVSFHINEESDGTQRLFDLFGPWWNCLEEGYTLFVDELDASMHPLLTRELVRSFNNPNINQKDAQLVFTTHDTSLLSETMLRRDQVWFTEKGGDGSTSLYSLHDYHEHRPRKGEAFERGYLSGRYGAIPDVSELQF